MSDIGYDFKALREHRRERKAANLQSSTEILCANGVEFESKNHGVHLIVRHSGKVVDFWPSTGKWIVRVNNRKGRGVFGLLRFLGFR